MDFEGEKKSMMRRSLVLYCVEKLFYVYSTFYRESRRFFSTSITYQKYFVHSYTIVLLQYTHKTKLRMIDAARLLNDFFFFDFFTRRDVYLTRESCFFSRKKIIIFLMSYLRAILCFCYQKLFFILFFPPKTFFLNKAIILICIFKLSKWKKINF